MAKPIRSKRRSSSRKRLAKSRTEKHPSFEGAPKDLSSHLRGLYKRVASQFGVDPSYVSRVARDERRSKKVEKGLRRELERILKNFDKRGIGSRQKAAREKKAGRMRTKRRA
jgi:hypothetical protein